MRAFAGITIALCLAAPLFAQVVDTAAQRPKGRGDAPALTVPQQRGPLRLMTGTSDAPLTADEITAFKRQVQACWLQKPALPSVTVGFSLDTDGRPDAARIRLVGHAAAPDAAVAQAFAAAKRAVLRCGRDGYTLPVEKYDQWRDIELTFTPERTILR